jgi:hypothetical protein
MEDWHEQVFGEIITNYDGKQYVLYIPRRMGSTTIIRRLATYFASIGKDVRVLSESGSIKGYPIVSDKPCTKNTVVLIDGLIKYYPGHQMRKIGATVITAHPQVSDYDYSKPFEIVKKMDIL